MRRFSGGPWTSTGGEWAEWGIRRHSESISSYFANLGRPSRWRLLGRALSEPVEGRRDEAADFHPFQLGCRPSPAGMAFLESASFALTPDEARFLRERVVLTHPGSLLSHNNFRPAGALMSTAPNTLGITRRRILRLHRCGVAARRPPVQPRASGSGAPVQPDVGQELDNEERTNDFSTELVAWSEEDNQCRPRPGTLGPVLDVEAAVWSEPQTTPPARGCSQTAVRPNVDA